MRLRASISRFFTSSLLLVALSLPCFGQAFVRENVSSSCSLGFSGCTVTITEPTGGNALILCLGSRNSTINDPSLGSVTWNLAFSAQQGNTRVRAYYGLNVASGLGTSLTLNGDAFTTQFAVMAEFSGVLTSSANDGSGSSNNGNSTTASTGNLSTSNANDVVQACTAYANGNAPSSQPSGYSNLTRATDGSNVSLQGNYKITSSTGTQSASWGMSGGSPDWTAGIYALKGVAAGKSNLLTLGVK